jgi:hypothetical protein
VLITPYTRYPVSPNKQHSPLGFSLAFPLLLLHASPAILSLCRVRSFKPSKEVSITRGLRAKRPEPGKRLKHSFGGRKLPYSKRESRQTKNAEIHWNEKNIPVRK